MADGRSAALRPGSELTAEMVARTRRALEGIRTLSEMASLPGEASAAALRAEIDRTAGELRASNLSLLGLAHRVFCESSPNVTHTPDRDGRRRGRDVGPGAGTGTGERDDGERAAA